MMALPSLSLFGAFQQVGNHLWQSTLCLAIVALLTLACRDNRAHVRHWLWLAASVKFLVPFAPLMAIGGLGGASVATAVMGDHPISMLPRAQAPIDVLVGHRVSGVEQADLVEQLALEVHARARHRQH